MAIRRGQRLLDTERSWCWSIVSSGRSKEEVEDVRCQQEVHRR